LSGAEGKNSSDRRTGEDFVTKEMLPERGPGGAPRKDTNILVITSEWREWA